MAKLQQTAVLAVFLLLFLFSASAIKFEVEIENLVDHNSVETDYSKEVQNVQKVNTTLSNTGSIGCKYRLKAEFSRADGRKDVQWSDSKGLWPGESAFFNLSYVPLNYTGNINGSLSAAYCSQERTIENFSFTVENRKITNKSMRALVTESNSSSAKIRSKDVDQATLVPEETPAKWKVSTATLNDGKATLEYEPTLFSKERSIKYIVVSKNGSVLGKMNVKLQEQENLAQKLKDNTMEIGLGASILLNLVLLLYVSGVVRGLLKRFKEE